MQLVEFGYVPTFVTATAVEVQVGCVLSDDGWSPLRNPLNDGVTAGVAPRWPVALPAVIVSAALAIVTLPLT